MFSRLSQLSRLLPRVGLGAVLLVGVLAGCHQAERARVDPPGNGLPVPGSETPLPAPVDFPGWSGTDPLTLLRSLELGARRADHERSPVRVLAVEGEAPAGWISARDVEVLFALAGSPEPALRVVSSRASFVEVGQNSTVGNQALHLIEGYRQGRYPVDLHGDTSRLSETDLRRWWASRKN